MKPHRLILLLLATLGLAVVLLLGGEPASGARSLPQQAGPPSPEPGKMAASAWEAPAIPDSFARLNPSLSRGLGGLPLARTVDGGFFLGASHSGTTGSLVAAKLDAGGAVQWQRAYYYPPGHPGSYLNDAQVTASGYVLAGDGPWVVLLNGAGDIVWQKWLPAGFTATSVLPVSDGYLVAGPGAAYGFVSKLAGNGAVVWTRRIYGDTTNTNYALTPRLRAASDGGFVMGSTLNFGVAGTTLWLGKFSSAGALEWQYRYGPIGTDALNDVQPTADGGYILSGAITSVPGQTGIWLIKLTSAGSITWQKRYQGSSVRPRWVQETGDHGYIVAAEHTMGDAGQLLRVDASGNIVWQDGLADASTPVQPYSVVQAASGGYVYAGLVLGNQLLVGQVKPDGSMTECDLTRPSSLQASVTAATATATAVTINDLAVTATDSTSVPVNLAPVDTELCAPLMSVKQGNTVMPVGASASYGAVPVGTTKTLTFTINNLQPGWLHLNGNPAITLAPQDPFFLIPLKTTTGDTIVHMGQPVTFTIDFKPQHETTLAATAAIPNNDAGHNPYTITVTGRGQRLSALTYGGTGDEKAYSLAASGDGGYVFAGSTTTNAVGQQDVLAAKLDAYGQRVWSYSYGTAGSDEARSIQGTNDGGYIQAGWTYRGIVNQQDYGFDAWLVKVSAAGQVQWQKSYGGLSDDYARSVQQTTDGGYILAGWTHALGGTGQDDDFWVLKLSAIGATLWQKSYGGTSYDDAYAVQQTSDGGYVVAGFARSFGPNGRAWVLKLDQDGATVWQTSYGGSGKDVAYAIQQTAGDNGYILAGYTTTWGTSGSRDGWVVRLDANGSPVWTRSLGGAGTDEFHAVRQTSEGNFILAGTTMSSGSGGTDGWLVKLDGAGDTLWQRTYGGAGEDGLEDVRQIPGGYISAGWTNSYGAGGYDFLIAKVNEDGSVTECGLGQLSMAQGHLGAGLSATDTGVVEHTTDAAALATSGALRASPGVPAYVCPGLPHLPWFQAYLPSVCRP